MGQKRKYRGYSQNRIEDGQKTKDRRCQTKEEGWRSEKSRTGAPNEMEG